MKASSALASLWPAAGVVARSGNVELRWMDDELIVELAHLATRGVHDANRMPFMRPWTRGTPEQVMRSVLTHQWATRLAVGPGAFRLNCAVLVDGIVVGSQGAGAKDWQVLRIASTGSWLGREFQGQGIGTRMRMLILHLLFEGLGAAEATTGAFADNPASNAVSRKVGYYSDGTEEVDREGAPALHNRYRMPRYRWLEVRAGHAVHLGAPIVLEGASALREELDQVVGRRDAAR
ncbi:MAG TPA: GNAT family protein [Humibacter sp.]|nr:GNAT family protein [Humibacter sp.]